MQKTKEMNTKKPSLPVTKYSLADIAIILDEFAHRLGQRNGQYLPTIQPAEDFFKEKYGCSMQEAIKSYKNPNINENIS